MYFIVTCDLRNHDRLKWLLNHILSFSQSVHTTYETMTDLNGFSNVFYHSHSLYTWRTKPWQTWMASQMYFIVLIVRTCDVRNHDRLSPVWGSLRLAPITNWQSPDQSFISNCNVWIRELRLASTCFSICLSSIQACMYVCVCVCMHTHMRARTHTHIYIYVYTYIHMYTCMYVCMYVKFSTFTHTTIL